MSLHYDMLNPDQVLDNTFFKPITQIDHNIPNVISCNLINLKENSDNKVLVPTECKNFKRN